MTCNIKFYEYVDHSVLIITIDSHQEAFILTNTWNAFGV